MGLIQSNERDFQDKQLRPILNSCSLSRAERLFCSRSSFRVSENKGRFENTVEISSRLNVSTVSVKFARITQAVAPGNVSTYMSQRKYFHRAT